MFIVRYRKFFYAFSGFLVLAAVFSLLFWGLKPAIDFKGGSLMEVAYAPARPDVTALEAALNPLNLGEYSIRPTGGEGYIFRMRNLSDAERVAFTNAISLNGKVQIDVKNFDSIGPVLGQEALRKAFLSIILVIVCIVLFITFAFRKVSEPVSSWKYGVIAIVALCHDVLIPAGFFAILGRFGGVEVDTLFVTALLVVLGFSVHDTIVVFDRVRENLRHWSDRREKKSFEQVVGESISQTFVRSVNTSLTTLLALAVLYIVGGEATRNFALALIVGITAGTYSSIFIGSPLLVTVEQWQKKRASKKRV